MNTEFSNYTATPIFSRSQTRHLNSQFVEPQGVRIVRILLEIAIGLFGVGGNFLVCWVIATRKRLRTVGNMFVFNLAVADLGVLLVCLPLVVIHADFPYSWPFGDVACKLLYPLTDIFYGVSIGSIVGISFHRYRMIVHCMDTQLSRKKVKILIVVIWILSYLFLVLPVNLVMELNDSRGKLTCEPKWPKLIHRQLHVVFVACLFYVLPLGVILGTYLRIRRKLSADSFLTSQLRNDSCSTIKARLDQNRNALRLLTPVVVAFALLMFPIQAIRMAASFHPNIGRAFPYLRLLYNASVVLLLANSAINCVIYAVINKDFRREFKRLLCCGCLKRFTESLPLPRKRATSESNPRFHSLYSANDPKTAEEIISRQESDESNPNHAGEAEGGEAGLKNSKARKARLLRNLKQYEVRHLLEDDGYANAVQYCAYGEKLTIVVK